jgi:hypothetical protein
MIEPWMIAAAAIGVFGLLAFLAFLYYLVYTNGVVDGYGYSREPENPGYRTAGEYLRRYFAHRWSELAPVPDSEKHRRYAEHKRLVNWCMDVLTNPDLDPEYADRVRAKMIESDAEAERLKKEIG